MRATGQDASLLPGRSLAATGTPVEQLVVARGAGPCVWDVDGRRYVDYLLGSGPLIAGHAHPAVVDAVQRQVALGSTFYALNEPALELAEVMVDHIPCAESVQFCTSGSEANSYALRIARAVTGRDAILKFEGGFHGANDYAVMSLAPRAGSRMPRPEPASAGVPQGIEDEVFIAPFNDLATVSALLDVYGTRIAAIIAEPVQRGIPPLPEFLPGLRELATRHGALFVLDEIVTGFRLGPGGAQEHYGVMPDLATYGKILGGGYALAGVAGPRTLMELTAPGRSVADGFVYINGTLNGSPVAAAAGLATIALLDEPGAYERLFTLGDSMRTLMADVFSGAGVTVQAIGVGPLAQVVISDQPVVDYRSARGDAALVAQISAGLLERGVLMGGTKAYLSLVHGPHELQETAAAFEGALHDARP